MPKAGQRRIVREACARAVELRDEPGVELTGERATAALRGAFQAVLTARVNGRQRFTTSKLDAEMVGRMVVVDVAFTDGTTVTLRIAPARARMVVGKLSQLLVQHGY